MMADGDINGGSKDKAGHCHNAWIFGLFGCPKNWPLAMNYYQYHTL